MSPSFKIVLFNIQAGVGVTRGYWQYFTRSWRYFLKHDFDAQSLKKFIEENNIDVLALTETSTTLGYFDTEKLTTELTGLPNHVVAEYMLWKIFRLGNALATRHTIVAVERHDLPSTGEQRPLLEARVNINGRIVRFFAAHFSLLKSERRKQIAFVADMARDIQEPLLLAADFNTDDAAELEPLLRVGLSKTSIPTYPTWNPKTAFDHIFTNNKLSVISSSAFPLALSDHLPLVAEIRCV